MSNFVSAYSPKPRVQVSFDSPSLAKQSFKQECDINFIMSKYQRTGVLDFVNRNEPRYGDVDAIDLQSAMDTVIKAQQMFSELPSSLRKRFSNDPSELLSFLQDPANLEEGVRLGLLSKPEPAAGALSDPAAGAGSPETGVTPAGGTSEALPAS